MYSSTRTEPPTHIRPKSLRSRSINMTCSARSFSLWSKDSISAASRSGDAPRGRVPAIGRVETTPSRIDNNRSGEELIKAKSPSRTSAANGLGLAARSRS